VLAPPSITLPKGGGAIRGIGEKFEVNPAAGTGSLAIPLPISPGRADFTPQLTLAYDSGSGNGPFGWGWSLSLPAITRSTDKRLPRYHDDENSDVFLLSGAEDLVPALAEHADTWARHPETRAVDGVSFTVECYRPRIEGLFARIERWTRQSDGDVHWRSISRDNVMTTYGGSDASRIADPTDPGRVFSWLACESRDDKGNAIVYEYAAEDSAGIHTTPAGETNRSDSTRSANRYLRRIRYGNTVSHLVQPDLANSDWLFQLVFDYRDERAGDQKLGQYCALSSPDPGERVFATVQLAEPRPWDVRRDPFSTFRAGFEVRTYRLCRRVLMFHHFPSELKVNDYLVRSMDFTYEETPVASYLTSIAQAGYVLRPDGRFLRKALPPLEFGYSRVTIDTAVHDVDPVSLEDLPEGIDGARYQWVDLDGEGMAGVLTGPVGGWLYKRNLSPLNIIDRPDGDGEARVRLLLAPTEPVSPKPTLPLDEGAALLDLGGDGSLDMVTFRGPGAGFYERLPSEHDWQPFRLFRSQPTFDPHNPNVRFIDLDNDGHADALVASNDQLTWYRSLAKDGFSEAITVPRATDEEHGPVVTFADHMQSVHLTDMTGDGLTDLVRIRNGEICYWPNLGYGRFGAKIAMDGAPIFDSADQFDPQRLRLVDIDGSGNTDIVYLGGENINLYFNQSGNSWSNAFTLESFPQVDQFASVAAFDLLGAGTGCLVWSSSRPAEVGRQLRYVDLMSGQKPHLLISVVNNLGAETHITYAPSTRFYLADKRAGKAWATRLPFPVHVVERVDVYDQISRSRFVTRYAYHHGYFDPAEREFRGFGLAERWDTDEFAALSQSDTFPAGDNVDKSSHVPPVLTRTWFHTGAFSIADAITRVYDHEYYREPGLSDAEFSAQLLPDSSLPDLLVTQEIREACRALKGSVLREETYGCDGTDKEAHPYRVVERSYDVHRLQPLGDNEHAVFLSSDAETVDYHYERNPNDPRVTHALTLEVDDLGQPLKAATAAYGRRSADPGLSATDQREQVVTRVTYSETTYTNPVDEADDHRAPIEAESRTYELTGYEPSGPAGRYVTSDFVRPDRTGAARPGKIFRLDGSLEYEAPPTKGRQRRLVAHTRTLYRADDLGEPLPVGVLGRMALPHETYRLAFTSGLISDVYGDRVTGEMLTADGGYTGSGDYPGWWSPSGRVFLSAGRNDTPAEELAYARAHFFMPRRYREPFDNDATPAESSLRYDPYDLLLEETVDALGNKVTVGVRDPEPGKPLTRAGNDYRVMQAAIVMDANRNISEVRFDALGMVTGSVVCGKPEDDPAVGDRFTDAFEPDPTSEQVSAFLSDPYGPPARALLDAATTRFIYDVNAYWREPDPARRHPDLTVVLARETHGSETAPPEGPRIQVSFAYTDGFGREIQRKLPAEPGPIPKRDARGRIVTGRDGQPELATTSASSRWMASGWVIFNNKGHPVREYEPFFTDRHEFEWDTSIGVGAIRFYDPAERLVATLHPDHTWEKVKFSPWRTESWDASDTLLITDPAADPDTGDFFRRLPPADYIPTWHAARMGGALGHDEKSAAVKASVHAGTPTVAHMDAMGRAFLTVVWNRFRYSDWPTERPPSDESLSTRTTFDIEGNQLQVRDANGRLIARYAYDILGRRLRQQTMEAGDRRVLLDVTNKPVYAWDSLGRRTRTRYDALRRPIESFLREGGSRELMVGRSVYGESEPSPEAANLRGKLLSVFDQAGVVRTHDYDFKGNPHRIMRQFAVDYKVTLDWSAAVPLDDIQYTTTTEHDALNRPTLVTTPDATAVRPRYNKANLLERVDAQLRGSRENGEPAWTPFVIHIGYDAKGRRISIEYGSGLADGRRGVTTTYDYDPLTSRLVHIATRRDRGAFPDDCPQPQRQDWPGCDIQNVCYTYDPVGNITSSADEAQQTIFFRNKRVEPRAEYTYDARYRLIEATGREHLGQLSGRPVSTGLSDTGRIGIAFAASDGNAMDRYIERYDYDAVGNLLLMRHFGSDPANPGWTRSYTYNEPSALEPHATSNRLTSSTVGGSTETYSVNGYGYDAHGNLLRMQHLQVMQWNFKDHLQMTQHQITSTSDVDAQPPAERTWYVYDSSGERVRKVTETAAGTVKNDRIYLGCFEVYRQYGINALVRETLHIADDNRRIALVDTRTDTAPEQLIRYQLANNLGSTTLEVDDQAQLVSYEEYLPYGATSYQAVRNQLAAPKRYRYTGKEQDEESGLYYCGARYYAPWLGRWTSADPIGLADGPNPYAYVAGNPIIRHDPTGYATENVGLGGLILYADKIANRLGLGANVQKDHAISQEIIKTVLGPLAKLYKPGRDLTTAVETGAAAGSSAARWHTVKSTLEKGVLKAVQALAGEGKAISLSKDIVEPMVGVLKTASGASQLSREQYLAVLSQLGNLHATTNLEQAGHLLAVLETNDAAKIATAVEKLATSTKGVARWTGVLRNIARSENALAAASKLTPLLTKLAPVGRVVGRVAGPLGVLAAGAQFATAKNTEQRVDAGITAASSALMMSKHPVALALGGGLMAGQLIDHSLNVSDYSSRAGVAVYEKLKSAGMNDTAAFVVGGVASVGAIVPAIGYGAYMKVRGWFH
jgi:RHS repeat-associated protein